MMVDSVNTGNALLDFAATWGLRIGLALVIFYVGRMAVNWIVRLTERYLRTRALDELIIRFATNILTWTLLFIVIIAALSQLGIDTTALIALLGAAGLAVGLALQDSMKNFASGVLLIIFRPFTTGHFIEAAGTSGSVESITLFTSTLRTPDNRAVIVPNGEIYSNTITNYSALPTRRVDMVFGIGYDDDLRKAKDLLHRIIADEPRILADPAPLIAVSELADRSVNFAVRPWVNTADYWDVFFAITERVKLAFDDNGISIPYPQLEVHVKPGAAPVGHS